MPEKAPDANTAPTGTDVMVPGYHRRLLRRFAWRHRTADTRRPPASAASRPDSIKEATPLSKNNTRSFLKRIVQYLQTASRLKRAEEAKQQANQAVARAVVKRVVKKYSPIPAPDRRHPRAR